MPNDSPNQSALVKNILPFGAGVNQKMNAKFLME
jgi:hypothetical protein